MEWHSDIIGTNLCLWLQVQTLQGFYTSRPKKWGKNAISDDKLGCIRPYYGDGKFYER